MPEDIRLILTAPPSSAGAASAYGLPVGHMAYRIGKGAQLLRAPIPIHLRGGLMVVDSGGFDGRGDANVFCQQVLRECASRGFDGALLDLEGRPHPLLRQIVTRLAAQFSRRGWPLYVPEEYADCSDLTRVMIPSALSGGSLSQRIGEAAEQYGCARVALAIQRAAEDFTLPAPSGSGAPLTREELARRIQQRGASVFFSDELCANYFTYVSRENGAHFVLFDTAASIRKKLLLARQAGLCACILAWPEVDDLMDQIMS